MKSEVLLQSDCALFQSGKLTRRWIWIMQYEGQLKYNRLLIVDGMFGIMEDKVLVIKLHGRYIFGWYWNNFRLESVFWI